MISKWSEWKRYPRPGRGENIEAPITPGIYEVRIAGSGALHSFDAVDNVAQALAMLQIGSRSWFGRRDPASLPDLEYRTCATSSRADAKAAGTCRWATPRLQRATTRSGKPSFCAISSWFSARMSRVPRPTFPRPMMPMLTGSMKIL